MLIILGLMNLTGVLHRITETVTPAAGPPETVHAHPHSHGDYVHTHVHGHDPEAHPHTPDQTPLARLDRWLGRLGLYQAVRPLVVGVVHGLAGSAAVALLVLTTIGNTAWAIAYLLIFGVGTIVGMMLITAGIAWPFAYAGSRFAACPSSSASRPVSSVWSWAWRWRIGSGWWTGSSAPIRGGRRSSPAAPSPLLPLLPACLIARTPRSAGAVSVLHL